MRAQKLDKGTGCESRTVTAAVSAEAVSVGESQSLGKPEKAGYGRRRILHKRKSEDLQRENLLPVGQRMSLGTQKIGCGNPMVAAAVLSCLKNLMGDGPCGGKEVQIFFA